MPHLLNIPINRENYLASEILYIYIYFFFFLFNLIKTRKKKASVIKRLTILIKHSEDTF